MILYKEFFQNYYINHLYDSAFQQDFRQIWLNKLRHVPFCSKLLLTKLGRNWRTLQPGFESLAKKRIYHNDIIIIKQHILPWHKKFWQYEPFGSEISRHKLLKVCERLNAFTSTSLINLLAELGRKHIIAGLSSKLRVDLLSYSNENRSSIL